MNEAGLTRRCASSACVFSVAVVVALVGACSSSTAASPLPDGAPPADAGSATCPSPGGPTPGPADTHCVESDGGVTAQPTSAASCHPDTAAPLSGGSACPYGDTLYGNELDDDDCKYHVTWSSTPICQGAAGVLFTVLLKNASDQSPASGANVVTEVFTTSPPDASCDTQSTHPGPTSGRSLTEASPGTYSGTIRFDTSGKWTVRLHFHPECADTLPSSQHGHAAFHVSVP